jgi:hypothetical protein
MNIVDCDILAAPRVGQSTKGGEVRKINLIHFLQHLSNL